MTKVTINLKTPISYYGGKQTMLPIIMPLIPKHETYTEVFAGGLALFWAKQPAIIDVVNDKNKELINFYETLKSHFEPLKAMIDTSLHSREQHRKAYEVYTNPQYYSQVRRAWAVWLLSSQTFLSKLGKSWGYSVKAKYSNKCTIKIKNCINRLSEAYKERLQNTTIECNDALKILKSYDRPFTFHYVDPPYINCDQGHYAGYTEKHYKDLLDTLATLEGKFLLSSYPNTLLSEYAENNKWNVKTFEMMKASSNCAGKKSKRIEVLAGNYNF
jgi:DNA adenine methylase